MVIVIIATQWIASTITIVMLMTCSTIFANIVVFFHHPHHNHHSHHLYHHLVCSMFSANLVVVVPSRLSSQLPPPPFPFWLLPSQHLWKVKTPFLTFNSTFYSISSVPQSFESPNLRWSALADICGLLNEEQIKLTKKVTHLIHSKNFKKWHFFWETFFTASKFPAQKGSTTWKSFWKSHKYGRSLSAYFGTQNPPGIGWL